MTDASLTTSLRHLAAKYETKDFLQNDPSWFMHQVLGRENQEVMAFIASVLSYGKRELFFPKLHFMLKASRFQPYRWVKEALFRRDIGDNEQCFYRLYNNHMMLQFLDTLQKIIIAYGSLGAFAKSLAVNHTALEVLNGLSDYFLAQGIKGMVPSPRTSVAKRPCMFLRWMVRDGSPVDLGLWADFIDKRTLFIPLDTHVMQEATRLGLIKNKSASWHTVVQLTDSLRNIFPDDPAKGDFALFGVGIDK
jgi:uncharacterized protein (TIGR02757 family)